LTGTVVCYCTKLLGRSGPHSLKWPIFCIGMSLRATKTRKTIPFPVAEIASLGRGPEVLLYFCTSDSAGRQQPGTRSLSFLLLRPYLRMRIVAEGIVTQIPKNLGERWEDFLAFVSLGSSDSCDPKDTGHFCPSTSRSSVPPVRGNVFGQKK